MKKILRPIKLLNKKRSTSELPSRITNDTVAEHREQILAGGRRFKYPVQYARHKLVANTIIISLVSVFLLFALGMQQIYGAQNSSDVIYRLTQIFPLPVATIANEPVRYSDYLLQYRGSEHYLRRYDETKLDSEDGKRMLEGIKRQALDKAEADSYAAKLAREKGIKVSSQEIDSIVAAQRNTANGQISQDAYDASSMMVYGWTSADYRRAVEASLLRAKVAFAIDDHAKSLADKANALIKSGKNLRDTASELGDGISVQSPGLINVTNSFNGLNISELVKIQKGEYSGVLKSTTDDGYYFVYVTEKNDTQVNFDFIHISLTALNSKVAELKKSNQIHEFIKVDN